MKVELKNCDLKINYIGTKDQIFWRELNDNIDDLGRIFREELSIGFGNLSKIFGRISENLKGE